MLARQAFLLGRHSYCLSHTSLNIFLYSYCLRLHILFTEVICQNKWVIVSRHDFNMDLSVYEYILTKMLDAWSKKKCALFYGS
jgi:hypothetical protein